MSLPRYPEYKDSGLDWLGQVPSHWSIKRLRFVADLNPSKSELKGRDRESIVSFLPMEAIGDDGSLSLERTRTLSEVETGYTYFRDGDVVVAKITPCFENGKGALIQGLLGGIGFGTTELIVARPKSDQVAGAFLNWMFRSSNFRKEGEASMYGAGGQKRVSDEFVRDFVWAMPPVDEQESIVFFIDREVAKIDSLIAEQEKLLQLLAEKRQVEISHAITRGLHPYAPMRESGIPWVGKIPSHWQVSPLKWLTQSDRPIMYGIVLPGPDVGEGVPILKGGNVKPSRMCLSEMARTTPGIEAPYARARLRKGDLVYAIRGTIGDCEIVPAEMEGSNITQDVARVAVDGANSASWVRWALLASAIREELACGSLGAAVRGVNIYDLKRVRLPVPPKEEQERIAEHINREVEKIDELVAECEKAMNLMREHRSALISAAVTGKIDVRGLVEPKEAS